MISSNSEQKNTLHKETQKEIKIPTIVPDSFEVIKPTENWKAVLILFGGFGEKAADTKREFQILELAKK